MSEKDRIGLFGGTFDPVHKGHVSIARSFLNSGFIDQLWVLLTPYPPHKEEVQQTDYDIRLRMVKAAFEGIDHVSILTIENELPKPSYSIQTIRHLKSIHPDLSFQLCIGEDSLKNFHKWKDYELILKECELLVAQRPGVQIDNVNKKILQSTHFIEHAPFDISSTEIKERIKKGHKQLQGIPDKVLKIIEKEHLYS